MIEGALLVGLASWRMASLLGRERGPFALFERFRDAVEPVGEIHGFWRRLHDEVGQAITCVWCCSLWLAGPMWALYVLAPLAVGIIAAAALAIMVEGMVQRGG